MVVLKPGNPPDVRSRGKQPRRADPKALVRGQVVRRCVSGHIPGRNSRVENDVGFRQAGRRGLAIGKDLSDGRTGWAEVDTAARVVGKHPERIPPWREWFALFTLCQLRTRPQGDPAAFSCRVAWSSADSTRSGQSSGCATHQAISGTRRNSLSFLPRFVTLRTKIQKLDRSPYQAGTGG